MRLPLSNDRYKDFVYLDKPQEFCELFKNQNFDLVQVHDITSVGDDIVGFAGQFKWQNNELIPLDHDSYTSHMSVWGYEKFVLDNDNELKGLDILSDDW